MQVIKRDGSLEEYSEAKITKVLMAAGLKLDETQILTSSITESLDVINTAKISSLIIRDKVIQELKKTNKDAANLYSWYEKTKE